MNIGLVIVSYNKPELTDACIDSAVTKGVREGDSLTIQLFNHHHPSCDFMDQIAVDYDEVCLFNYGENRGLAKSWNDGIHYCHVLDLDAVIIANADMEFREDSLSLMARAIVEQKDRAIIWCNGEHQDRGKGQSMGYSLFGMTEAGLRTLGYFDQNFFPAYGEDCDYDRRIKLSGLAPGHCDFGGRDDAVFHVGSAHLRYARGVEGARILEQTAKCQELNNAYFYRKWGLDIAKHSTPEEGYLTPFNDPETGIYISYGTKDHPYGKHDRTDQSIVTV
jgi:glycosyltransferase involved in cell wall biosynthesis